jgi:hypothetical protein
MGQTVTQGTPGHNQPWHSMLFRPDESGIARPCPFSVQLCKFEVVWLESAVTTRGNIR